jgi:hypothetical protein
MKSQDEEFKELKKVVEDWETIERKSAETLFHYKQQHEALGNQVEALTMEKRKRKMF